MKSSKATEELNKAKIHLMKAKREMSQYMYDGQTTDLIQINSLIDKVNILATSANAQSISVPGSGQQIHEKQLEQLTILSLNRKTYYSNEINI